MKKIFYLMSSLMLVFTACDPMEDVYEELDKKAQEKPVVTTVNTTFIAEDYKFFADISGAPAYINKNSYFATEDEAIELIPARLLGKYAHLNDGSTASVTFNKLSYNGVTNSVAKVDKYTLVAEDYDVTGDGRFDNFNSAGDLEEFLNYKYPDAAENHLVVLTFDYYLNGRTTTITDSFIKKDGIWNDIYHVTSEDYASVGKRADFSSSDDAVLNEYFNKFLTNRVFGVEAGDVQYVSYAYYNSSTRKVEQRVMAMAYNGTKWVEVKADAIEATTLKFKKENGVWNVDFTVAYTLVNSDYIWIGVTNPTPDYGTAANRDNLQRYKSFFTQKEDDRFWSQAEIDKALIAFVKYQYPNPKKGVKYQIFYKIYDGSTKTVSVTFKRNAAGEYEVDSRG